jgi:hypothetical protein
MPEGVTMSYNQIKQCKNQLINTVTSTDATGDATLGVTNRTFETVLSNYLGVGAAVGPKLMELRDSSALMPQRSAVQLRSGVSPTRVTLRKSEV